MQTAQAESEKAPSSAAAVCEAVPLVWVMELRRAWLVSALSRPWLNTPAFFLGQSSQLFSQELS